MDGAEEMMRDESVDADMRGRVAIVVILLRFREALDREVLK